METVEDVQRSALEPPTAPFLFVVLEGARPRAGGMRISLREVDEIRIVRGPRREVSRIPGSPSMRVLSLPSPFLSSEHARIRRIGEAWVLDDAGSRNGTYVDGHRVEQALLADGAWLEVGRVFLTLAAKVDAPAGFDGDVDLTPSGAPAPDAGLLSLVPSLAARNAELVRVARADVPILLVGPSGAGKEWLARAIHRASGRSGRLSAVNCGAIPGSLVESTLFGHARGAFSGATRDELGLVRSAHRGTLLLDEVADLPHSTQVALLRVLQDREVTPVGASQAVAVDTRFVSATWQNLEALVEEGRFRHDLLARIAGYVHRAPALVDRRQDLGLIIALHLAHAVGENVDMTLDADAARALLRCRWPRNARQLTKALDAALARAPDGKLGLAHFDELQIPAEANGARSWQEDAGRDDSGRETTARKEPTEECLALPDRLVRELRAERGNVAAVARRMNKAPFQIHRWMKRYGVSPDQFRQG